MVFACRVLFQVGFGQEINNDIPQNKMSIFYSVSMFGVFFILVLLTVLFADLSIGTKSSSSPSLSTS